MSFNEMSEGVAWTGLVISVLSTLFFGFKFSQASGESRLNNVRTSIGKGSFIKMLTTGIKRLIWAVLCLLGLILIMMFYFRLFP